MNKKQKFEDYYKEALEKNDGKYNMSDKNAPLSRKLSGKGEIKVEKKIKSQSLFSRKNSQSESAGLTLDDA